MHGDSGEYTESEGIRGQIPADAAGVVVNLHLRMGPQWVLQRFHRHMVGFSSYVDHEGRDIDGMFLWYSGMPTSPTDEIKLAIRGGKHGYHEYRGQAVDRVVIVVRKVGPKRGKEHAIVRAWLLELPELIGWFTDLLKQVVHGRHKWIGQISVTTWKRELDPAHDWEGVAEHLERQLRALSHEDRFKKRGGPLPDTLPKVARARFLIEHGLTRQAAYDYAEVSPKTYRKYDTDPDFQEELAQLMQDEDILRAVREELN